MLPELEEHDILTLWYLLQVSPKKEREIIVEKISEIIPLLNKSTIDGLRNLNEEDLEAVLDLIKWMLIEDVFISQDR